MKPSVSRYQKSSFREQSASVAETLRISLLNASKLSSSALDKADVRQTVNDLLPSVESPILIVTESSFGIGFDIYKIFVLWDLFSRQKKLSGFCFVVLVVHKTLSVRLCVVDIRTGTHDIRHPEAAGIDFFGDLEFVNMPDDPRNNSKHFFHYIEPEPFSDN
jgi:hypothetical protein